MFDYQQILLPPHRGPNIIFLHVPQPSITYRKATSLKDSLVYSQFSIPKSLPSSNHKATVPCGSCDHCYCLDTCNNVMLPNGVKWHLKHNVICTTMGLIYLLQCSCCAFYVGKTRRPFNVRIAVHIKAATSGFFKTVIVRHFAFIHDFIFSGFKFLPLVKIDQHDRGGNWDRALYRAESRESIN